MKIALFIIIVVIGACISQAMWLGQADVVNGLIIALAAALPSLINKIQ